MRWLLFLFLSLSARADSVCLVYGLCDNQKAVSQFSEIYCLDANGNVESMTYGDGSMIASHNKITDGFILYKGAVRIDTKAGADAVLLKATSENK